MKNLKEGLVDNYIYMDGKKFIGQVVKTKENEYKKITDFKRKTREQYISFQNSHLEKREKALDLNKDVPTDIFIVLDKYNPLGKNIERDFEEINIDKLELNSVNSKKYLILKIFSKIYVDKSTNFICEDSNKDLINISINDSEKYFNVKSFDMLEKEIYTEGKYIIVIEPNYGIFNSDIDEIKILSPSEIIILNDKEELYYFLDKNKNISPENYKLLGNLMLKNYFYEKAIFYYSKGINMNKDNDNMDIILHSNLSEAYIKYEYFSKSIKNADYCLDKINKIMQTNKDNFLVQQKIKNLFRKIKGLVALRKFKEAYQILFNESENNPFKDIINDFLNLEQVKKLIDIIRNGYENNLGHFNFRKMLQDEKINFFLNTYGDYISPKIEIKYEKDKGIKVCAKEKIHEGELLIVEKAIVSSRNVEKYENEEDTKVSKDNPKVVVEIELFNKLSLKLKKSPLDNEKFYYLCDGKNLGEDLNERRKYLDDQDKGKIDLSYFKVNQVICLNKYGIGRDILYFNEICVGVWGYSSFFNHDCLPNSTHCGISDYYIGYSIRDIDKGEEITSKYCDSKLPYNERQQTLLENWRFKCSCQLCKYQEKKNDSEYNNYIKLFDNSPKDIPNKNVQKFEEFLERNKKKYSCYDLANAYLKLEKYYFVHKDFNNTKKCSDLVSKYASGKNYSFQLSNLNTLLLCVSSSHGNEFFAIYQKVINYLKKYTPFTEEELHFFFRDIINQK